MPLTWPVVVPVPAELAPHTPAERARLLAANLEGWEYRRVEVDTGVAVDGDFQSGVTY